MRARQLKQLLICYLPAVELRAVAAGANLGCTFFQNDFHQPLASLMGTVLDRQQRRLRVRCAAA